MTRRDLLAQAADGADRNNPLDAEFLHGEDIGAKVHLGGQPAMAAAMARQKNQLGIAQLPRINLSDGFPKGVLTFTSRTFLQPFDLVEPAAADHPDDLRCHNVRIRLGRDHGPRAPFSLHRFALQLAAGSGDVVTARPPNIDLHARVSRAIC